MSRFVIGLCVVMSAVRVSAAPPKVLDDRLKLELFAEQPQIVTPTGIDVDHLGRVWAIESNTHFPPDGYKGHPTDRVLVLEDTDADGRADKVTPFADGLTHAMSVVVKPVWLEMAEGLELRAKGQKERNSGPQPLALSPQLFLATRKEILLLRDTNNDLRADERTTLVRLDTPGNYPHNGLAGIAFDALGWMFFGFGENLGADYKLIGSDGVTLSGGGEGGNIYRCRPDGTKLERWATGFWNPHASCFDAFGRLFTVDNDPDSRPPCRLLHIIPGGDYGYRFRNGRKGTHPFTSWNGEIPGTLPMVSGTGEAPSGILCYESDGFPDDYLGTLLVGTWGDHRIDQFVLEPKGASFTSRPKPIVQGDETFRPVGLALAPDGSVFFTDWVLKDYKLHGKGRVWRLSAVKSGRHQKTIAALKDRPSIQELFKEMDDAAVSVRRITARRFESLSHELLNKEINKGGQTTEENKFLAESIVLSTIPRTERHRYESLMAETAMVGLPEWSTEDEFNLEAVISKLGPTTAAYFRLYDPIYGESSYEGLPKLSAGWGQWSDRFRKGAVQFHDQTVSMELARRESLLSSLLGTGGEFLLGTDGEIDETLVQSIDQFFSSPDPFVLSSLLSASSLEADSAFRAAENLWATEDESEQIPDGFKVFATLAARRRSPQCQSILSKALASRSSPLRRIAVQWVGEEKLVGFRPRVEAILNDLNTTPDLFRACLATLSLLDGVPASEFEKTPPTAYALAMVTDPSKPAALRATALRMLPPATPELPTKLLLEFLQAGNAALQTEAVRTLMQSPRPEAVATLAEIVANPQATLDLRADAIVALSAMAPNAPESARIDALLLDGIENRLRFRDPNDREILQLESIRAARNRATEGTKLREALGKAHETASVGSAVREAIDFALAGKNDSGPQPLALDPQPAPSAGRRAFFSPQGAQCAKCHTVHGRGGNVGPDLSVIARTMDRQKLFDSIVNPSKEISPQYLTWSITTTGGKVHTGIIVSENGGGDVELGDAQGNIIKVPRNQIDERTPSPVSVMPQGLHQRMTPREFAEVISYLETLK